MFINYILSFHGLNKVAARFNIFKGIDHDIRIGRIDGTDGNDINHVVFQFVEVSNQAVVFEFSSSFPGTSKDTKIGISAGFVVRNQVKSIGFYLGSLCNSKYILKAIDFDF